MKVGKQGVSKAKARSKQEVSKTKARRKQGESKAKASSKPEEEADIKMNNRLKYRKYNQVVAYVCQELTDELSTVTTDNLMENLNLGYQRAYVILRELKRFGFLKLKYKSSYNFYYGVFNSTKLKLRRFEQQAKNRITKKKVVKK